MTATPPSADSPPVRRHRVPAWLWALGWLGGSLGFAAISAGLLLMIALAAAYPKLPDISAMTDYRPKQPLRIFTQDEILIGEFGEEKRQFVPFSKIPKAMKQAVLAAEDANFYEHGGVDYRGLLRSVVTNVVTAQKAQGGSTISMQVARNIYLSAEKTYTRKIYEILLTYKLEHLLSKDQILEVYLNQIFLGNRAFGFAAASLTYFGKPLNKLTLAETAMLAGIPKAPSAYNPFRNPKRAKARQQYVIDRMLANGFITDKQAQEAKAQPLDFRSRNVRNANSVHGEYVAEMARLQVSEQFGELTYTHGINVYTTLIAKEQEAAHQALQAGLLAYESRQPYRGPEATIQLPAAGEERDQAIDEALNEAMENSEVLAGVVTSVGTGVAKAVTLDGEEVSLSAEDSPLSAQALAPRKSGQSLLKPGAVIRLTPDAGNKLTLTQLPLVQGAVVGMNPRNGNITALVGGFDFSQNKFNNATQAWRQPGSSFKPFVYSAALEKGLTPATVVNDAPISFTAAQTGSDAWEPKNYDGTFDGPMTVRQAMAKSKNLVSVRVLQLAGPQFAQNWVSRFGFDPAKHPPYLTMALGAGSVTPLQMATGYAVFANGGSLIPPRFIQKISDTSGKLLYRPPVLDPDAIEQVIPYRNAFVMSSLLNEVTHTGTAASAHRTLGRDDIFGKTGTTNDSVDAWFVGYHPNRVAAVWVGHSQPKNLGSRETGGGLSLPIWTQYMQTVLRDQPVLGYAAPNGLQQVNGDWVYSELGLKGSVKSLGLDR